MPPPAAPRPELAAIFCGGALGALARSGLEEALTSAPGAFPWATFAVNVAGAAILGLVVAYVLRVEGSPLRRPFWGTGVCGALTTFSTLQLELIRLVDADELALAATYLVASVAVGLAAVAIGARLGGRPMGRVAAADAAGADVERPA